VRQSQVGPTVGLGSHQTLQGGISNQWEEENTASIRGEGAWHPQSRTMTKFRLGAVLVCALFVMIFCTELNKQLVKDNEASRDSRPVDANCVDACIGGYICCDVTKACVSVYTWSAERCMPN